MEELFPHRAHVNGRVITLTNKLRTAAGVDFIKLSDAALARRALNAAQPTAARGNHLCTQSRRDPLGCLR